MQDFNDDLNTIVEITNEIKDLSSEIESAREEEGFNDLERVKNIAHRVDSLKKWNTIIQDSCSRKDNELEFIQKKVQEKQHQVREKQQELDAINKKLAIFQPQPQTSLSEPFKSIPFFNPPLLQKWIDEAISNPDVFSEKMKQLHQIQSDLTTQTQKLVTAKEKGY